jgi:hypothetical protein
VTRVPSPLENLSGPGQQLRKEPPDAKEFANLKQSGLKRLADAENKANSAESRFDLAYNAAYALCLAALRRSGYRAANRYIVFQVLPHTLGLGPEVWRFWREVTTSVTAVSMKAIFVSMNSCSPT